MPWHYACIDREKNTMAGGDLNALKKKVVEFLKQQDKYSSAESISVKCDEGNQYYILYGADIQVGVAGFGETADGAYNDFVDNWKMYRGKKK